MKVGFLVPSLHDPSGWRSAAIGTVRALRDHALVEPTLFVRRQDAEAAACLFADVEVITLPETQHMSVSRVRSWPALLATRIASLRGSLPALDLVHSLDAYPTGLVGDWLARRCGIPHVLTALGTYAVAWSVRPVDSRVYSRVLSQARLICPISTGTAELMARHFPGALDQARVRIVHLGTDMTEEIPRAEAWDRQPSPEPLVLTVGAVKPRKGLDLTIAAFQKVEREFPSARLVIVGDPGNGVYKSRLVEYADQIGAKRVRFVDPVDQAELHRLYRDATLFALTPRMDGLNFEGFGLVYLEAGAFGLPVVATDSGGVPDAVRHGVTGFVEPEDAELLAASMLRILREPSLARRMGRANREHAEAHTWRRFAANQMAAYRSAMPSIFEDESPGLSPAG